MSTAVISDCGQYRYHLTRVVEPLAERGSVVFVMLNPSTADASVDDQTIRKCIGFTRSWGYARMEVVNLFAYRATDRTELRPLVEIEAIGPENDAWIEKACRQPGCLVVCAWGTDGALHGRGQHVLQQLRDWGVRPRYLKLTKDGHPSHPLYLAGDLRPQEWV